MRLPMKHPIPYIAFLISLPLLAAGGIAIELITRVPADQVAPGVHIFDLNLGGKSLTDAQASIENWISDRTNLLITLKRNDDPDGKKTRRIRARTLGLGIDLESTLNNVLQAGTRNPLQQAGAFIHNTPVNVEVNPTVTSDSARLKAALIHLSHLTDKPAQNAQIIQMADSGLGLKHDVPGRVLDIPAAVTDVLNLWQQFNQENISSTAPNSSPPNAEVQGSVSTSSVPAPSSNLSLTLPTQVSQAKITYAMVSSINGELSSYGTWYREGDRGDNIALAASRINGRLLMPGQLFSFNQTVGPRVLNAGFKIAPVIIKGQLQPGVGGGICQVSGTLYNAVLKAGLETVLRTHHTFPVSDGGIPTGRDATVAFGELDFQFMNNMPYPVYIAGSAHHGYLEFNLFGHKEPGKVVELIRGRRIERDCPVDIVSDPSLPAGRRIEEEDGRPDVRMVWYRVIKKNGIVVSREEISSHYDSSPEVIRVGSGAPKARPRTAPIAPSGAPTAPSGGHPK